MHHSSFLSSPNFVQKWKHPVGKPLVAVAHTSLVFDSVACTLVGLRLARELEQELVLELGLVSPPKSHHQAKDHHPIPNPSQRVY